MPLSETEDTLAAGRTADTWEDQGYLLILALLPLALGLFRRGWLLTLLPALLFLQPEPASAQTWNDLWLTPDQQGQRALQQGNNEAAATLFENPEWAGTAAYNHGDYEAAIKHFNDPVDADSLYNRGNALARAGQLDEAIAAYEQSLQRAPDLADARENLELVKKIQEQQQQQKQQQDQQQDQQEQNEQQNQQNSQDQQEQQNQNQQQDEQSNRQQDTKQNSQDSAQSSDGKDELQEQEQHSKPEQQQAKSQQEKQGAETASGTPQDEDAAKEPVNRKAGSESANEEHDQALEQWLRRVPDDPSGLLRQKFRYESLRRQEQGLRRDDEAY